MEKSFENFSPQQSLELITSMINGTRGKIQSNRFYFLLWGWVITLCNLGMYYFMKYSNQPQYAPWIWTLTIPTWVISMVHGARQDRNAGVITHLDRILMWLWIGLGISIQPAWIFGAQANWLVNAIILMPIGLATFLSGIIIRFKPLVAGGIICWVASILCCLSGPVEQYLIGALAVITGHLIPGYLLKK